jgi:hypothetical protein
LLLFYFEVCAPQPHPHLFMYRSPLLASCAPSSLQEAPHRPAQLAPLQGDTDLLRGACALLLAVRGRVCCEHQPTEPTHDRPSVGCTAGCRLYLILSTESQTGRTTQLRMFPGSNAGINLV